MGIDWAKNYITRNYTDKLINITVFEKYGLNTLENLKLRINMGNDLVYLGNYNLLGYVYITLYPLFFNLFIKSYVIIFLSTYCITISKFV